MARLTVRFNYFRLYLENETEEHLFNPEDMFDYILMNRDCDYSNIVNPSDFGEVDSNAFYFNEVENIYYFQIAKLRNENLPDKKRVSSPREDLQLEQNEYISEFLTFIFDKTNLVSMIQVNRNSLTIKELEIYLTQLRNKINNWNGKEKDDYYVKCRIVPDPEKLNEVRNADFIRRITLNGSRVNLDALQDSNSLKQISDTIGLLEGVNFKLEISVETNAEKNASLEKENLLEIIDEINADNNDIKTKVAIKEDIDTSVETVNLVEPRMTDIIKVEHDNRRNLGVEFLYNQFMDNIYSNKRDRVRRLLYRGE